jgi:hypothetical protein
MTVCNGVHVRSTLEDLFVNVVPLMAGSLVVLQVEQDDIGRTKVLEENTRRVLQISGCSRNTETQIAEWSGGKSVPVDHPRGLDYLTS